MPGENEQQHLSGNEARAGVQLGVMRYVLGISLFLVIAIFVVILWAPFG